MKKINPRCKPATMAEVRRARKDGYSEGIRGALTIMIYALKDKFSYTDEQLQAFSDAFNYTVDSIARGYITQQDLQIVIKDEYGTTIECR